MKKTTHPTTLATSCRSAGWLAGLMLAVVLAGCEGSAGDAGAQGPKGPSGQQGDKGDGGDPGPGGDRGEDGAAPGAPPKAPRIHAVRPDFASAGTLVTIVGEGFSPSAVGNQVRVDGRPVEIVSASADRLVVRGVAPEPSLHFYEEKPALLDVVTSAGRSNAHAVTLVPRGWVRDWPLALPGDLRASAITVDETREQVWLLDDDSGVYHLDPATKTLRLAFSYDEIGEMTAVASDSSDRFLVATSRDGGRLVEVRDGRATIADVGSIYEDATAMALGPGGELFVTSGRDVYLQEIGGSRDLILSAPGPIVGLAVSADRIFVQLEEEDGIQVYSREDGSPGAPLDTGYGAMSIDADRLYFVTYDWIYVYDLEDLSRDEHAVDVTDRNTARDLRLLADGSFLVLSAYGAVAADLEGSIEHLAVGIECVYAGVAIGDDLYVGDYGADSIVRIGVEGEVQFIAYLGFSIDDLWVDHQGRLLVGGSDDGVHRVDPSTGEIVELVVGESDDGDSETAGGVAEDGEGTVYFTFEAYEDGGSWRTGIGAVDLEGGESRVVAMVDGGSLYSLTWWNGRLYYLGSNGRLWSLDPEDAEASQRQESGYDLEDLYGTSITQDGVLLLASPDRGLFELEPDGSFNRVQAFEWGGPSSALSYVDGVVAVPSGDAVVLSCSDDRGIRAIVSR